MLDTGEVCDGTDVGGATCEALGFDGGDIECAEDCTFDASGCTMMERCGNGLDDDGNGKTDCDDPACAESCPRCGDGTINTPGEACDGDDVPVSCADFGHSRGVVSCDENCKLDASACHDPEDCGTPGDEDGDGAADCDDDDCSTAFGCPVCGNGVVQDGEECEPGTSFSCSDFGFDEGEASCSGACSVDTSGCSNFVCGDGVREGTEQCDDGNAVGGDGCSSGCFVEGDSCAAPIPLLWSATDDAWTWQGTTIGNASDYVASCASTARMPDVVGAFTAPSAGQYFVTVDASFDAILFGWNGTCGQSGQQLGCANEQDAGGQESFEVTLAAGQTIYLVVGGSADVPEGTQSAGPFLLTVRAVVCNDGVIEGWEQCEDGNVVAGDGCSPLCRWEGDSCADAIDLNVLGEDPNVWSWWSWGSTTERFLPDYSGSCSDTAPRDAVIRFQAPMAGSYFVQLIATFDASLYVWDGACGQSSPELSCADSVPAPPLSTANVQAAETLQLAAQQVVYLVVDGHGTADTEFGEFWLDVGPMACGDGVRSPVETCDDGNLIDGDGCSSACSIEASHESEPNDTFATARQLSVGETGYGFVLMTPLQDVDIWSFLATAGTHFEIETGRVNVGDAPDTYLRLYDATGVMLAENDDIDLSNEFSRIAWTAPASGTYYIRVEAQRVPTIGQYVLDGAGWEYLLRVSAQ